MGDEKHNHQNLFSALTKRRLVIPLIMGLAILAAIPSYFLYWSETKRASIPSPVSQKKIDPIESVSAVGRLEPLGNVIKLSAPAYQGGAKIVRLFVKEGDWVQPNSVIAILDNHDLQQSAVERNQAAVRVALANLEIVKAGSKQGEIEAQKAIVERLKAELKNKLISEQAIVSRLQAQLPREKQEQSATVNRLKAELDNANISFVRYQQLLQSGAIAKSEFDQRFLNLKIAQQQVVEAEINLQKTVEVLDTEITEKTANFQETQETLNKLIQEAEANLARLLDVRDVDVTKATEEVAEAKANLKQAQEDLALTYVKSPQAGQILKIYSRPGEYVNADKGILEFGQTKNMVVIAEVYESDISKVRPQQIAIIKSENDAFTGEIKGKVNRIGLKVDKQNILEADPASDTDSRVVQVEIHLNPEDSRRVSHLTYSQVIVKILLHPVNQKLSIYENTSSMATVNS